MSQHLGRITRQMAVKLPNGGTLVVHGHPIIRINGLWHCELGRSLLRDGALARTRSVPLFPATVLGRGTGQVVEDGSCFRAVPPVPCVPRGFKQRSRFAEGSKEIAHGSPAPNR